MPTSSEDVMSKPLAEPILPQTCWIQGPWLIPCPVPAHHGWYQHRPPVLSLGHSPDDKLRLLDSSKSGPPLAYRKGGGVGDSHRPPKEFSYCFANAKATCVVLSCLITVESLDSSSCAKAKKQNRAGQGGAEEESREQGHAKLGVEQV